MFSSAASMANQTSALAGVSTPARRIVNTAIVLPTGCGDGMDPGGVLWEGLVKPFRMRADIFALSVPWGILPESTWLSCPGFLDVELDLTSRQSSRDASDRVRAWMNSKGSTYQKICLINYGNIMDVWTRGAGGSAAAERVRLIKVPRDRAGISHPSVHRALSSALGV